MSEHPVQQEITCIEVPDAESANNLGSFTVGRNCTRIEACTKSGMHADIPYVRVWKGDIAIAEFCQHYIIGVYFAPIEAAT